MINLALLLLLLLILLILLITIIIIILTGINDDTVFIFIKINDNINQEIV